MVDEKVAHRANAQTDGDVADSHALTVGDFEEDQLLQQKFVVRDAQQNVNERDDQHRQGHVVVHEKSPKTKVDLLTVPIARQQEASPVDAVHFQLIVFLLVNVVTV